MSERSLTTLYAVPHAGAAATVFRPWTRPAAARGFAVRGVDRPGAGERRGEPAAVDLADLVASTAGWVSADLAAAGNGRLILFGHSFGTLVALAVAARLAAAGTPVERVVVSAGLPPRHHESRDLAAGLDDDDLRARIAADGATPAALLDGGPVTAMLLRRFRADHRLRAEFAAHDHLRTDVALTVVSAADDIWAPAARMHDWARHTSGPVTALTVPGGHFAVVDDPVPVLDHLAVATSAAQVLR